MFNAGLIDGAYQLPTNTVTILDFKEIKTKHVTVYAREVEELVKMSRKNIFLYYV